MVEQKPATQKQLDYIDSLKSDYIAKHRPTMYDHRDYIATMLTECLIAASFPMPQNIDKASKQIDALQTRPSVYIENYKRVHGVEPSWYLKLKDRLATRFTSSDLAGLVGRDWPVSEWRAYVSALVD